jgi:putative transposase
MRRKAVQYLVEGKRCNISEACRALQLARSTYYGKREKEAKPGALERRIMVLSKRHPVYGYRFITALLRDEGWVVNGKCVQRLRRMRDLQVVTKKRKMRRRMGIGGERQDATRPNEVWSYDFVHDELENGVGLKMLTVLDEFTRECLGILVARSITAADVVNFLELLMLKRGEPAHVRSDNGPEFVAEAVKTWLENKGIRINYIEPGSPWENGHVESFHDKLRKGCLSREVFGTLLEARVIVEEWRQQYNQKRPHSSLGYKAPARFAREFSSKLRVATLPSALS